MLFKGQGRELGSKDRRREGSKPHRQIQGAVATPLPCPASASPRSVCPGPSPVSPGVSGIWMDETLVPLKVVRATKNRTSW